MSYSQRYDPNTIAKNEIKTEPIRLVNKSKKGILRAIIKDAIALAKTIDNHINQCIKVELRICSELLNILTKNDLD